MGLKIGWGKFDVNAKGNSTPTIEDKQDFSNLEQLKLDDELVNPVNYATVGEEYSLGTITTQQTQKRYGYTFDGQDVESAPSNTDKNLLGNKEWSWPNNPYLASGGHYYASESDWTKARDQVAGSALPSDWVPSVDDVQ